MLKNTCPFSLYLTSLRPGLLAPVSVARVDLIGDTPEELKIYIRQCKKYIGTIKMSLPWDMFCVFMLEIQIYL